MTLDVRVKSLPSQLYTVALGKIGMKSKKEEIHHMEYKFRQMGFNLKISIPFIFSKISN